MNTGRFSASFTKYRSNARMRKACIAADTYLRPLIMGAGVSPTELYANTIACKMHLSLINNYQMLTKQKTIPVHPGYISGYSGIVHDSHIFLVPA